MSNACPSRDESLLLFAHGQLGFWASLAVKWHARNCPQCRERLARYSSLSGLLSTAMASPGGPRWLPTATFRVAALRGTAFLLVAGLLTFGIWSLNASANASAAPRAAAPAPADCASKGAAIQAVPVIKGQKDCGEPKAAGLGTSRI